MSGFAFSDKAKTLVGSYKYMRKMKKSDEYTTAKHCNKKI